jgi:hypothetical protein
VDITDRVASAARIAVLWIIASRIDLSGWTRRSPRALAPRRIVAMPKVTIASLAAQVFATSTTQLGYQTAGIVGLRQHRARRSLAAKRSRVP